MTVAMTVTMPGSAQVKPQPGQLPAPRNLQVVKPDLVVVSVTPGALPNRPVLVKVQNIGNGASTLTNVKISCVARSGAGGSSNCQPGSVSNTVHGLSPGALETVTLFTGPLGKGGKPLVNSRVTACVDSANSVKESNESNNCGQGDM